VLAALSVGAALVHIAMVPAHAAEWLPEGLAFAAAAWLQLAFAAAVLGRPRRALLSAAALANAVFVAAWAVTRTAGMPFGPQAGSVESVAAVDLTCAAFEAALVVAALVLAARPRLGESLGRPVMAAASIVPAGILVLSTAVIASPSASQHSHGSDAGADHGHETAAGGHTAGEHDNAPALPAADDRCDWSLNTASFWAANPPTAATGEMQGMDHGHGDTAGAGGGVGNQHGQQAWRPLTDPAACARLGTDIARMEALTKKYPTAQDAIDAGCRRITSYIVGIAAHYLCVAQAVDGHLTVEGPEMLLYGGNSTWAPLVGLSYYDGAKPGTEWLEGQMPFHVHQGLCIKDLQVVGGDGSDQATCEAAGGKVAGRTGYMGHYWRASCPSPDGVFSADNPRLDAGVAVYNDDPRFDPATGGDPTVLVDRPCEGSKVARDTFGRPTA
jgi:hypothetical protein